jgi:alpha-glucosidase
MVPVTRQTDRIEPRLDAERELVVFGSPQEVSETWLYEDDGDTSDWQGDGRLELRFRLRRDGGALVLSLDADGSYRPAFEAVSVRPVSVPEQIRFEASNGAVRLVQGARA